MKRALFPLSIAAAMISQPVGAITIQLRYDYDTSGFFNQAGAKAALRAVADYYEVLLNDSLGAIDPTGTSNTWVANFPHPGNGSSQTISNLVVPANTVIVFVGARSISPAAGQGGPGGWSASGTQTWINTIAGRGQAGALATPKTDFAPWGGAITFDPSEPWSFSTTGPVDGKTPFVSIALHEFGHLFGIGTADSWDAKIVSHAFTGATAVATFGKAVPLDSIDSHWQDDGECELPDGYVPGNSLNVLSKAYGSFNALHGYAQIALMDPVSCSAGPFLKVMTDLDLAALKDIGWELTPPSRWQAVQLSGTSYSFTWPSTTGTSYRVQTSTTLTDWTTVSTKSGDGTIQSFSLTKPSTDKAFFRLNTASTSGAAIATQPVTAPSSQAARVVTGCRVGTSYGQHE